MDALTVLKERRSIRRFQRKEITKDIIEDIVDCGRLATTAVNIQPWEFIAVTDAGVKRKIADVTDYGKFIAQAPLCIVVFCRDTKYYLEDGCAATENILLAAKAYGLGSCWVAGDKKRYAEDIRKLLNVPERYKLVSLIAIGYPAESPSPSKRSLQEVLHWDRW